jgi:hypothetical protein
MWVLAALKDRGYRLAAAPGSLLVGINPERHH